MQKNANWYTHTVNQFSLDKDMLFQYRLLLLYHYNTLARSQIYGGIYEV